MTQQINASFQLSEFKTFIKMSSLGMRGIAHRHGSSGSKMTDPKPSSAVKSGIL